MTEGVVLPSYFDYFVQTYGFTLVLNAPFEVEFARLAGFMKWKKGGEEYKKQLQDAKTFSSKSADSSGGATTQLNTIAAHGGLVTCKPGFKLNPSLSFDIEFNRLVLHINPEAKDTLYNRHYLSALILDTKIRELRPLDITFFDNFTKNHSFVLKVEHPVDSEFVNLSKHMNWVVNGDAYLMHWKVLLKEATTVATLRYNVNPDDLVFFKKYITNSQFSLQGGLSIEKEFKRLAQQMGWNADSSVYHKRQAILFQEVDLLIKKKIPALEQGGHTRTLGDGELSISQTTRLRQQYSPMPTLHDDIASTTTTGYGENYTPAPSSYFTSFSDAGFEPNPYASIEKEFDRLSCHMHWSRKGVEHVKQWRAALAGELESQYGDSNDLVGWQHLCTELGIEPAPQSITKCKKALKLKHVNIVDLVNARRIAPNAAQTSVKQFDSAQELRRYCQNTRKFFPKTAAKDDGFVKILLTQINPPRKRSGRAGLAPIPEV